MEHAQSPEDEGTSPNPESSNSSAPSLVIKTSDTRPVPSIEEYVSRVSSMLPKWKASDSLEDAGALRRKNAELCKAVDELREQLLKMQGLPERAATLEKEVARLCVELDEATDGVNKRGYLYKWRDRDVQIGAKWVLRYFVLCGNHLSYYGTEKDVRPWKTISLERCIVGHEGTKKNGQYHVFGIYLAATDETHRGPNSGVLLRLSTDNEAEAVQWVNLLQMACQLGSENSSSSDTDLDQVGQLSKITNPDVSAVEDSDSPAKVPQKHPASLKLRRSVSFQKDQTSKEATRKRSMGELYPASRPMHVTNQASLLSEESPRQNYRGLLNLAFIILVFTHFRLVIENLLKYGFLLKPPTASMLVNSQGLEGVFYIPLCGLGLLNFFALYAFLVEKFAKDFLSEKSIMCLNVLNCTLALFVPMGCVYFSTLHPVTGMLFLGEAVVMWLKLISYAHVNRDLRLARKSGHYSSSMDTNSETSASKTAERIGSKIQIEYAETCIEYPDNLTLPNFYYFLVAPTLCYQLNYPRSPSIRWNSILSYTIRFVLCIGMMIFVFEQYIAPILRTSIEPVNKLEVPRITERLLKVAIPTTYVWILGFYVYFHLWLNLIAELLRFGDRMFYKDWWNSRTVETYWRLWNMPVHHWMIRHLYFPALRMGFSKHIAIYACFFFSAVFHEVLISIPFHTLKPYAFLGMLAQAPLVIVTKQLDKIFDNAFIGNAVFWITFCMIGQPMGVLMYYYAFQADGQVPTSASHIQCNAPFDSEL